MYTSGTVIQSKQIMVPHWPRKLFISCIKHSRCYRNHSRTIGLLFKFFYAPTDLPNLPKFPMFTFCGPNWLSLALRHWMKEEKWWQWNSFKRHVLASSSVLHSLLPDRRDDDTVSSLRNPKPFHIPLWYDVLLVFLLFIFYCYCVYVCTLCHILCV